jgi:predicted alpha/beta-hydrolase family hydrolase
MNLLHDGPEDAPRVLILAHGAGGPMDSALLTRLTLGLAEKGTRVVRFEFPYMAARRTGGGRGMPDRQPILLNTWREVFAHVKDRRPLFIGGHSMGGRMASMMADELKPAGLLCVSYPWHPPEDPHKTRVEHLKTLETRTVMVCGTRDTFGSQLEVAGYGLPPSIAVHWVDGGDHSLKAQARSGRKTPQNLDEAVDVMDAFMRSWP